MGEGRKREVSGDWAFLQDPNRLTSRLRVYLQTHTVSLSPPFSKGLALFLLASTG